jgi:ribosomal protein L37AE/L43A
MINFCLGAMSVLLAYAFFSPGYEEEIEDEHELVVSGLSNKLRELSCQTCRKLKNHREIEPGVFECVKCHRRIYTR